MLTGRSFRPERLLSPVSQYLIDHIPWNSLTTSSPYSDPEDGSSTTKRRYLNYNATRFKKPENLNLTSYRHKILLTFSRLLVCVTLRYTSMVQGLYVADLRPWGERKNYGQITETNEGAQRLELVTISTSIHLGFLFVCRPLFSFFFGQLGCQHCPASTCSHLPSVSCTYQTVWRYCLARKYQKRKSGRNFPCSTYYAHPLHHDITGSIRLQLILGVATVTAVYRRQVVALLQAVNQLLPSVPWLWYAVFCTAFFR